MKRMVHNLIYDVRANHSWNLHNVDLHTEFATKSAHHNLSDKSYTSLLSPPQKTYYTDHSLFESDKSLYIWLPTCICLQK